MTDQIVAKFECSSCGPTEIEYDEKLGDSAPVFCAKCGADFQTTYGAIKSDVMARGEKVVGDMIKDTFKGTGWKVS
jgi:predicted nucleic acid-binding Zn ribbon protein